MPWAQILRLFLAGQLFTQLTLARNVPYVVDHFSDTGANVTKELWDKYILCDEELAQLIREADCSIFEDSIEILSASPFWSTKYQEYFKQDAGYDLTRYLPYITSAKTCSTDKVSGYDPTKFYGTNSSRYIEDYFTVLSNMYQNLFVGSMLDWCHNDLDALYRTQAYITKGISVDTGAVSLDLDITEGESFAWKPTMINSVFYPVLPISRAKNM